MVIQTTPTKIDKIASLRIGQRGENLATDIKMDVSDWIAVHPDANFYCLFKRPDEVQVQPVLSSLEEDVLTWTVRAWECAVIGVGYLEVRAVNPDTGLVAKSRVIPCAIEDSVIDDEGPVPPEMSWVGEVLAAKDTAVAAKTAAEGARDTAQTTVNGAIAGIQAEGQTQVGVVQAEGTTQVGAVQSEGTTQVGAVQAKGEETLASIPSDYTTLSDDVTDLKSAINVLAPIKESTEEDVDLDISDPSGNVIVRLADGHIQTKEFDSSDLPTLFNGKQNVLTFDDAPISGSNNPVKSDGIYNALQNAKGDTQVRSATVAGTDLDITDATGNVLAMFANGNVRTKKFNSDNGIYESRFEYEQEAGTAEIVNNFPAGTRLAFHLTDYNDRVRDAIRSNKVTYKYTDTNGITRTLGTDYGYNFPEYTLQYDAVSVSVQYGNSMSYSDTVLSFKVYSMASFPRTPNVITVSASGDKDYTSLRDAVEYARQYADQMNMYEIHIYPGTYDIMSYYTTEEKAVEGFIGLLISNGIDLVGIGHRSEVILTATLSTDDYTVTQRNYVSTLNIQGDISIRNLTIKAENIRYAVHDDLSMLSHQKNTHIFEYVTFVGKNLTSSSDGDLSYGAGGADMKKLFFYNCDFTDALTLHTTNDILHEYTAYFENCRARLMQFGDYDSGIPTHIYLVNCCVARVRIGTSGNHDQYMLIEGEGTNGVMVESPSGYVYAMDGVHKFAGSNISAGTAVKLSSDMKDVQATTSLNEIYGISIGTLGGTTYVQTEGWLNSNTLGLSGLSVGDYLTIDNSGAVVSGGTSANAIAVVKHINSNGVAFAKMML